MTTIDAVQFTPHLSGSSGVRILGRLTNDYREILTPEATSFLAELSRRFECRRQDILHARIIKQSELDHGAQPNFPSETAWVRNEPWTVAPIPCDLLDRRVEISGPVDRQTMVTALNSGANLYMADFEDGNSPTWDNNLRGQVNLRDAVDRVIGYEGLDGDYHALTSRPATLSVRPRGWHLVERGFLVDDRPIAAALFDFGLFFFHNAHRLIERGSAPYLYLPKLENHFEARLWNDVFLAAQDAFDIPKGTIRATVIIENVLAAFEMDEILYELRDHSSGLRHGRWDYIFSFVRKFRLRPECVLPDRCTVSTERGFVRASMDLLLETCHRRGIHAIGGKAAHDPVRCDAGDKSALFQEIMESIQREVHLGFDGTQIVHPGLVPFAKGVYDARMTDAHQIDHCANESTVTAEHLLSPPAGCVTEHGLRANIQITIRYLASWLGGRGIMAYDGRMENAGTAEISRAQVWQWQRHGIRLDDGRPVTAGFVREIVAAELAQLEAELSPAVAAVEQYDLAAKLTADLTTGPRFHEFMTDVSYQHLH